MWKNIKDMLEQAMAFLVLDDPFSSEILSLLTRVELPSIPTMGVRVDGAYLELAYNPDFLRSLTEPQLRYGLIHEVMHLAHHHCTNRRPSDPTLMRRHNIAADLAVNSILEDKVQRSGYTTRIEGALLPAQFNFPDKLSLEQYYELLSNNQEDPKKEQEAKKGGSGTPEEGQGTPGDSQGEDLPKSLGSHGGFDSHDGWADEENALAGEIIRQKIREMENSERFWGTIPGDVRESILAAQRSNVAWHRLLRMYYGQHTSRNFVHTFKRPNRRFGYPYTGYKRDCSERALILWDTSASVQNYELSQFIAETNRMTDTMDVDVQLFDSQLIGDITHFDRKVKSFEMKGRGGTSFKEPFELADRLRYSLVVCLTDGGAPAIPKPKHVREVIWAITGNHEPPVTWGRVVHIDSRNGVRIPA
jgi:predicted metal-dependent peptidase